MAAKVDKEKCTACERRVQECPSKAVKMVDDIVKVDTELCNDCGTCVDVCPVEAISME